MEIKNRNPLKHNSKVTEIKCIRCGVKIKVRRNDAKTCSSLCRVQEGIERKEKGYTHRVFRGNKNGLNEFLNNIENSPINMTFNECIIGIREGIKINDNSASWKVDGKGYRLVFFPNNKKHPFELYFDTNKYSSWNLFLCPPKFIRPTQL